MKLTKLIYFLFIPFFSLSQSRTFEIYGTIEGEYNSKAYLFFENNFKAKDSVSTSIENGKFYFKGTIPNSPALARLHLDQTSHIADVFIEGGKIHVNCSNKILIQKNKNNTLDTTNIFSVVAVQGSKTENLRKSIEYKLNQLDSANKPEIEKREERYEMLKQFVNTYPKSRASVYILSKSNSLKYLELKDLASQLDSSLTNTIEWQALQKLLVRLDRSKVGRPGQPFHDFVLADSSNVFINLKDIRGKYTVIVLWASWCGPCRRDNPELNKIYAQYKNKDVQIIGVSIDTDKALWKNAIVKDKLLWPQLVDPRGEISKYYGLEGVPQHIVLDENGKIIVGQLSVVRISEILEKHL